ncbi:MAG: hypothetical protein KGH66_02410 [Candidatus Micrarchaeota archaeon]|nr:hypothetical protein [Candidatus Micrarchaeota archaeon]
MARLLLLAFAAALMTSSSYAVAAFVGSSSINALAVDTTNNTGSLTLINLTVTSGNGNVSISGPAEVANSTIQSASTAAQYASGYLGLNFTHYNFAYYINSPGGNVSGPSAGAALTLLAISSLSHNHLNGGMAITGTISQDGSVGPVGGVYDKVTAAENSGAKYVLVPSAPQGSAENMLYALVQANTGVPLIEVSNISQAYSYAFGQHPNLSATVTYTPFVNYHAENLSAPTLSCSNSCNMSIFQKLINSTFQLGRGQIYILSTDDSFAGIASQLGMVLNQSMQIGAKGYLYAAANQAFLNYVNTFYFVHHTTSIPSGLATAISVQAECNSLVKPQLTSTNYEYVISGEMRQYWGNYTINNSIIGFNTSGIETDEVLDDLYLAGQASGWCSAAGIIYGLEENTTGTPVYFSSVLKPIAQNRINRAAIDGQNLYVSTARTAYAQGNYGVAMLDSDFSFAFSNATFKYNLSTGQLLNLSSSTARGATFGAWATLYGLESQF